MDRKISLLFLVLILIDKYLFRYCFLQFLEFLSNVRFAKRKLICYDLKNIVFKELLHFDIFLFVVTVSKPNKHLFALIRVTFESNLVQLQHIKSEICLELSRVKPNEEKSLLTKEFIFTLYNGLSTADYALNISCKHMKLSIKSSGL